MRASVPITTWLRTQKRVGQGPPALAHVWSRSPCHAGHVTRGDVSDSLWHQVGPRVCMISCTVHQAVHSRNSQPSPTSVVTQRGHYIFVKFLLGHAWNKTRWKRSKVHMYLHLPATLNNVSNMGIWRIRQSNSLFLGHSHCGVRKSEIDCKVQCQVTR